MSIFALSLRQKKNQCRATFPLNVEITRKIFVWVVLSKEVFSTSQIWSESVFLFSTLIYFRILVVVWWKLLYPSLFEYYIMCTSFKLKFLSKVLHEKVWFGSSHWRFAALQSVITPLCLRQLGACQCLQT